MPLERKFITAEYWDKRFKDEECYDWVRTWEEVATLLKLEGVSFCPCPPSEAKVYVPGVGTSTTILDLILDGFTDIVATDYAETAVERQAQLFARVIADDKGSIHPHTLQFYPPSFGERVTELTACDDVRKKAAATAESLAALEYPAEADVASTIAGVRQVVTPSTHMTSGCPRPDAAPTSVVKVGMHVCCATDTTACGIEEASVDLVAEKGVFDCLLLRPDCEKALTALVADFARVLKDGGLVVVVSMHHPHLFGGEGGGGGDGAEGVQSMPSTQAYTTTSPDTVYDSYFSSALWEGAGGVVRGGADPVVVAVMRRKPRRSVS